MTMPRVYLAGPDVFFKDGAERAAKMKKLCADRGLEGVYPLDANIKFIPGMTGPEKALLIFEANVALIRSCQGVLANMTPFRGPSTDVGTAWEMGYAHGLGIPVVGYTDDGRRYAERVTSDGHDIEDFNLVDNLMLAIGAVGCSVALVSPGGGSAEWYAVRQMAALLGVR
jgi:nucleoside 2-deoxyribosyltransferase